MKKETELKSLNCRYDTLDLENIFAIDMGSGTTKSKSMNIDRKNKNYVDTIAKHSTPIAHQECLNQSISGSLISEECMHKGINKINELLLQLKVDCNNIRCIGVATAWAREAKNSGEYFYTLEQSNLHVVVISQETEARLGYLAAKKFLTTQNYSGNFLAFDIGGGSFEASYMQGNSTNISIYNGLYGSINFFSTLKTYLQRNLNLKAPLVFNELLDQEQLTLARLFAKELITEPLRENDFVKDSKNDKLEIFAIGEFMNKGLRQLVLPEQKLSLEDFNRLQDIWSNNTQGELVALYPELGKIYIPETQTNLILIEAIMNGLGINHMNFLPEVSFLDVLPAFSEIWSGFEPVS